MTVGELITELQKYPKDHEVWLLDESEKPIRSVELCYWAANRVEVS